MELVSLTLARLDAPKTVSVRQAKSAPMDLALQLLQHAAQIQTVLKAKSALMELALQHRRRAS